MQKSIFLNEVTNLDNLTDYLDIQKATYATYTARQIF